MRSKVSLLVAIVSLWLVLATAGPADAQAPFTLSWPHNPLVETYTVYAEPQPAAGKTVIAVVTAAQCTGNTCAVPVPEPTVRTCYPIMSSGLFQSKFNEIELCWRPPVPIATPQSTTGSKP
jgi:hypothetical protein